MAKIYADLIKKHIKTFCEVPLALREQVKTILIDCGKEELIEVC